MTEVSFVKGVMKFVLYPTLVDLQLTVFDLLIVSTSVVSRKFLSLEKLIPLLHLGGLLINLGSFDSRLVNL